EGTLPVELSAFYAIMNPQSYVAIGWITETETNCLGFNIYRGSTDEAASSLLISDMIQASNTSQQQSYYFVDQELSTDGTYYYWLENIDFDGSSHMYGPAIINATFANNGNGIPAPLVTGIRRIYPNPFNPTLFVNYELEKQQPVTISVYNARGQLIKTLISDTIPSGRYRVEWNGTNKNGASCANGLYFIRFIADGKTQVNKALLLK
ncbi:MAG: T9SS type A sorting domain-containing protein, partial [Candidatus Cloacimonadaceae bacterium]|nr:T9SS type A sorting domain-containing protein [Candidatus Cloacimonadaceae bacterium]